MQKTFKKSVSIILLILLVCLFQDPGVCSYANRTSYPEKTMLSPLSLFDYINTQKYIKTDSDKKTFLKLKLLDVFLQDETNINYIFEKGFLPPLGSGYKKILDDIISFESLPIIEENIAYVKVKLLGNSAKLYFFKNKDSVIMHKDIGIKNEQDFKIASQRRYWFHIQEYKGKYYEKISLTHKGTKTDPLQVVLIMPRSNAQEEKPTRLPGGLMTMASCLRDKDYWKKILEEIEKEGVNLGTDVPEINIHIIDLQAEKKYFDLEAKLQEIQPDIVGVSAVTPLFGNACDIASKAERAVPNAIRIIGGIHISAISKEQDFFRQSMFDSDFQIAVTGEGDEALVEIIATLLKDKDITAIPHVVVKKYKDQEPQLLGTKKIIYRHGALVGIEEEPLAAASMDLLNIDGYAKVKNVDGKNMGVWGVLFTSRGCPQNCSFCASKAVFDGKIRFVSAQKIFEEMKYYYQKGVKAFYVMDDNFCLLPKRIKKLASLIEESDMEIEYRIMARADSITEDLAKDLKRSGCRVVALGVESGDDIVLDKINKKTSTAVINRATKILQEQGIHVKHFLMVGLPEQDWKSIKKTAELMLKTRPDLVNVSITMPYPGTRLYYSKEIYVKTKDLSKFVHEPESKRKFEDNVDVITMTESMNSADIARARMLLLELFKNRDDQKKVDDLMNEIDERIKGVSSAGNIIKKLLSNQLFIDRVNSQGQRENLDLLPSEMHLLLDIGILTYTEEDNTYTFSDILPSEEEQIVEFFRYLIKKDKQNGSFLFELRDVDDKEGILKVAEIIRIQSAHFSLEKIKAQEKQECNIVLWAGYGGFIQKSMLSRLGKSNDQDSINIDFENIDEIVDMALDLQSDNQVFILPHSRLRIEDRLKLDNSGANIIYVDVTESFSESFSVNIIEGLITAGYAYLLDNEDVFYTAYSILTKNKGSLRVSLKQLKNDPSLFLKNLSL